MRYRRRHPLGRRRLLPLTTFFILSHSLRRPDASLLAGITMAARLGALLPLTCHPPPCPLATLTWWVEELASPFCHPSVRLVPHSFRRTLTFLGFLCLLLFIIILHFLFFFLFSLSLPLPLQPWTFIILLLLLQRSKPTHWTTHNHITH
jgi:hypothetical protein